VRGWTPEIYILHNPKTENVLSTWRAFPPQRVRIHYLIKTGSHAILGGIFIKIVERLEMSIRPRSELTQWSSETITAIPFTVMGLAPSIQRRIIAKLKGHRRGQSKTSRSFFHFLILKSRGWGSGFPSFGSCAIAPQRRSCARVLMMSLKRHQRAIPKRCLP
jgi:hypothetical protein